MNSKLINIDFKKIKLFSNVVKYKSIAETSKRTGLSRRQIYNDINSIENAIKETIILKNRKDIILTDAGKEIIKYTSEINEIILTQENNLSTKPDSNDISISCPGQFSYYTLPYAIKHYSQKHPESLVMISLYEPNNITNVFEFDIVIGIQTQENNNVSQHLIKTFTYGYYASSDYLNKYGLPQTIEDLKNHIFIQYDIIQSPTKNLKTVIRSDSYFNVNELVLEGVGIALLSNDEIKNNSRYSNLVRILPDIPNYNVDITLSFLKNSSKKMNILEILEHCKEYVDKYGK